MSKIIFDQYNSSENKQPDLVSADNLEYLINLGMISPNGDTNWNYLGDLETQHEVYVPLNPKNELDTSEPKPTLGAALDLFQKGFNIFPLGGYPDGIPYWFKNKNKGLTDEKLLVQWCKTPVISEWAQLRTKPLAESQIKDLWIKHPYANIGIITEDLVIVDADSPEAVIWCKENSNSPVRVKTRKGYHFYFKKHPAIEIKGSVCETRSLDVRAKGNYVVGPGSTHGSGAEYTWDIDTKFSFNTIDDLPEMTTEIWEKIGEYTNVNSRKKKKSNNKLVLDESHPDRGFNNRLTQLVGRKINEGYSEPEIFAYGLEWNNTAEDPMSSSTTFTTIRSIIEGHNSRHPDKQVPKYPEKNELKNITEPNVISYMNERHFCVPIGSSYLIAKYSSEGKELSYFKKEAFRLMYQNKLLKVNVWDGDNKKVKTINFADFWLSHLNRREYERVVFKPSEVGVKPDEYNLWEGFDIDNDKLKTVTRRDCRLWLKFMKKVICGGNKDLFNYLLNWCADAVQNPEIKPGILIVLKSEVQGTGKSFFSEYLGDIWGKHYHQVSHPDHITGKFNGHLEYCLLLGVEEAAIINDKKAENILKDLITRSTQTIERKNINAQPGKPNFIRFIFTGNRDKMVDIEAKDRRFQIFEVSPDHKNEKPYFKKIHQEWINGGKESFFNLLKNRNIEDFDFTNSRIIGSETIELKKLSWNIEDKWFHQILDDGNGEIDIAKSGKLIIETFIFKDDQINTFSSDVLYEHYRSFHKSLKAKNLKTKRELSSLIKKWCPDFKSDRPQVKGEKITKWLFPKLRKCRQLWDNAKGVTTNWD
jgi:hypothetical protein